MLSDITNFAEYLREVKKTSRNTELSYQRDLIQLSAYLEEQGNGLWEMYQSICEMSEENAK